MKVINVHRRMIQQPAFEIARLFDTLASGNDMMLATNKWPAMKLDKGLQVGSKGGHGPIRYSVMEYRPKQSVTFRFDMKGFNGFHRFDVKEIEASKTELIHVIDMRTTGSAVLTWALVFRWLHDAFIEDAFDKVENYFTGNKKSSQWSWWVRTLRKIVKPKRK